MGYIARKFPQFQLGFKFLKVGQITLTDKISGQSEKLMKPTDDFDKKLRIIGNLFNCYHGEKGLKPGKCITTVLAPEMEKHINLSAEVISSNVRCRTFFSDANS